ncbi:High mobility group [Coemansia sp. RSA 988]|nr:High mobility group [Coemansia sp. RSA 988]
MVPDNNATRSISSTANIRRHAANVDNIQEIDFYDHIQNTETCSESQIIEREAGLPHATTAIIPAIASTMSKHGGRSKTSGVDMPYRHSGFLFSGASEAENAVFNVADTDMQWGHAFASSHHHATDTADLYAMLPQNSLPPQPPAFRYQYNGSSTASLASIQPLDEAIAAAAAASPLTAATTAATTAVSAATIDWTSASCLAISATSNNNPIAGYSFAQNVADNAEETNMMTGSTLLHDILPSHIYQTFQSAPSMDNLSSLDNLAAPFQSLRYYHRQHQHQQDQQSRQQQQLQSQLQQTKKIDFSTETQSSLPQIPSLMFDIPALNNVGSDVSSSTYSKSISMAPMGSPNSAGNYPLSFDPSTLRGSASVSVLNGATCVDGMGQMTNINAEDAAAAAAVMCAQNTGTSGIVSTGQLPLSRLPGGVNNAPGFLSSPLSTPLGSLPGTGALHTHHLPAGVPSQPQIPPQHSGQMHPNMARIPQGRPYNMLFGVPGLPEPPMVYDDRMSMPPMHHGGGGWLRIKQPIDYVAPLKKPMNSFLLYSAERRVQLRQTHPDLNTTQQSTILAREWANLPEEEKEKYRAEAKQLRDDYNARRAELSLKLQQQLNQQHLGLGLGHLPPPPLPHPSQGPVHPQSQDLFSQAISVDSRPQVYPEGGFGLQQQQQPFVGSGMQMAHTQLPPPTPAMAIHNQHTMQDEVFQTQPAVSTAADQFQFATTLSSLDPAGGESNIHAQSLDFTTNGLISSLYGDKRDSKWQEPVATNPDLYYGASNGVPAQPYNFTRPPSNVSQHVHASEQSQQVQIQRQQYRFDESNIINSGMLSTASSLFDNPFDGVFRAGQLDHGSIGNISEQDSRTMPHTASYLGLADIQTTPASGISSMERGGEGSAALMANLVDAVDAKTSQEQWLSGLSGFSHGRKIGQSNQDRASSSSHTSVAKSRGRLSSPAKRPRKKSKKDPDAPKHPMSAFLYYLTSERPRLAGHLRDMSIGQQTKIIAKQWKIMDENDRAPWEKLAKQDKDRYARERREYQSENRQLGSTVTLK